MGSEDNKVSRITDFEDGVKAMEENDFDSAINNFQKCMKKLSNEGLGLTSELFPKCLQNISSCYSEKDDMENALSFKKFEKLYYETVLLHNGLDELLIKDVLDETDEQSSRDRGDGSSDASGNSVQEPSNQNTNDELEEVAENQTVKRASEYEQLAKLCLQQECISLALEYSGKATILFRHQFGDEHEKTKKSFDFFTSIYAEAGKRQYSESMEQSNLENNSDITTPAAVETLLRHRKNISQGSEQSGPDKTDERSSRVKRQRSILKRRISDEDVQQRNNDAANNDNQRRVTFADPLPQLVRLRDDDETDNSTTNLLLFFLICLLIILVSLLMSAIYCQMNPTTGACVDFRRQISYYYNKMRYLYRSFF